MIKNNIHTSVMTHEVISYLKPKAQSVYFDGTYGGGGHTRAILESCDYQCTVVATDVDASRMNEASHLFSENPKLETHIKLRTENFSAIKSIAKDMSIAGFDGIVLDLGLSSHQLEQAERGFSFQKEGPLDMRMSETTSTRAVDIVNHATLEELQEIFSTYGEEEHSRSIARRIIQNRPVLTTTALATLICNIKKSQLSKIHPATKVFQALRIAVNEELLHLQKALHDGFTVLKKGGRFVVISFHSLEDRLVKKAFLYAESDCECPQDWPMCQCTKKPYAHILTKKPQLPSKEEQNKNRRSRSAKMRVAEKI